MGKTFEDALALFVQKQKNLNYLPIIVNTSFKDGQEIEYSEYTTDYENAKFTISYKNPLSKNRKLLVYEIDISYYGFAELVKDIVALMI